MRRRGRLAVVCFLIVLGLSGLSIWWSGGVYVHGFGQGLVVLLEQGRCGIASWTDPTGASHPPVGVVLNRFPANWKWLPEYGFRPAGVSLALPLWPFLIPLAALVKLRRGPLASTACRSCGYDLNGVQHGPCPECGAEREA
jgi:hypothetical protein